MTLQPNDDFYAQGHESEPKAAVDLGFKTAADHEIEDLVHSWKRVTDPKLRKIALGLIRSMASP